MLLTFMETRDQKGSRPLVRQNWESKLLSESPCNPKDKMCLKYWIMLFVCRALHCHSPRWGQEDGITIQIKVFFTATTEK